MNTFTTISINDPGSLGKRLRLAWAVATGKDLEVTISNEEAKAIYEKYKKDFVFDGPKEVDPDWVKKQVLAMTEDPAVDETDIQRAMEAMEEKDAPVEIKKTPSTKKPKPRNRPRKPSNDSTKTTNNAEGKGPRTRRQTGGSNSEQ